MLELAVKVAPQTRPISGDHHGWKLTAAVVNQAATGWGGKQTQSFAPRFVVEEKLVGTYPDEDAIIAFVQSIKEWHNVDSIILYTPE